MATSDDTMAMYVMSMRGVRYVMCDSMMTVQVRTASIYAWLAVVELSSPAATRVAAMTRLAATPRMPHGHRRPRRKMGSPSVWRKWWWQGLDR